MNDLELIKKRLDKTSITDLETVATKSGVPFGTLHKIKYGKTTSPRFDTVKKLADFYRDEDAAAAKKLARAAARSREPARVG